MPFAVHLKFHDDLPDLLARKWRGGARVAYPLDRRTSIKDIIESLGLPHTEIDRLTSAGRAGNPETRLIDFNYIPLGEETVEVYPVTEETDFFTSTLLRPKPLPAMRFIADVNVGKLAGKLRLLGFDTLYQKNLSDDKLARTAALEERVVLSRDKGVLMRKKVVWGHLVRSEDPEEQLIETVRLFRLSDKADPYTLCQHCNGRLKPVAKEEIDHLLKPLTRKYYDTFRICGDCGQIYWAGSHRRKMDRKLSALLHP